MPCQYTKDDSPNQYPSETSENRNDDLVTNKTIF